MGLGVSLILIAAGAILNWAINVHTNGVNLHTIGWILIAVGGIGALLALAFWSTWWGPGRAAPRERHTTVVDEGPRY